MVMSALIGLWLPRQMVTTALTAPSLTVLTVPLIWLRALIFMMRSFRLVRSLPCSSALLWRYRLSFGDICIIASLGAEGCGIKRPPQPSSRFASFRPKGKVRGDEALHGEARKEVSSTKTRSNERTRPRLAPPTGSSRARPSPGFRRIFLRCPHLSIGFPYSNCINSCISRFPSA